MHPNHTGEDMSGTIKNEKVVPEQESFPQWSNQVSVPSEVSWPAHPSRTRRAASDTPTRQGDLAHSDRPHALTQPWQKSTWLLFATYLSSLGILQHAAFITIF